MKFSNKHPCPKKLGVPLLGGEHVILEHFKCLSFTVSYRRLMQTECPRAPLTYLNDRGVQKILGGLKFWPNGIFLGRKKTGIWGVLYFSSAQLNNNI